MKSLEGCRAPAAPQRPHRGRWLCEQELVLTVEGWSLFGGALNLVAQLSSGELSVWGLLQS